MSDLVLVPRVPTEEMIDAAVGLTGDGRGITAKAYARMIASAPPQEGVREKLRAAVRKAITRRLIAETDPVLSFNAEYRLAEMEAALDEATRDILSSLRGEGAAS